MGWSGGAADVVSTMVCGDACPILPRKRHEDWLIDDPAGRDLKRSDLFGTTVWGERGARNDNTRTVHLGRIRRRLEGPHGQEWIRSIRGFGYQFLVPHQPQPGPTVGTESADETGQEDQDTSAEPPIRVGHSD